VLGVPVGLDDDFFELGGNSLFAVRIGARMRERGMPPLQLRELYRHPTIRSVVSVLGEPLNGVDSASTSVDARTARVSG
jgi:aryl carrier-like protein